MYQKEIIYMGLHKDGSRLGSAGFLRVEKRDQAGSLSLRVKNVPHSINGRFPVRYYSGTTWKEVDGITLQEGGGQWEKQEQDSLEQVRLQIMLPGGYLVEGASRPAEEKPSAVRPEAETSESEVESEPSVVRLKSETSAPKAESESAADITSEKQKTQGRTVAVRQQQKPQERTITAQQQQNPREKTDTALQTQEVPLMSDTLSIAGLKEDKWEQILDTYDRIHPYNDERVYVKLEPKDFLILSSKYQHLVNNSFLLHGFYNYRHVILGKEKEYYLGVPGVFYEREKMVALMFGFEAFECESGDPKAGEFGYYLRKVEL